MEKFLLNYRTNMSAPIISVESVEKGMAIIEKLTANAQMANSKVGSVEFFIDDWYGDVLYTSPRFVTSTVGDINDIKNLIV